MSVNDKFDEWLLLLGIALRNRETRGLLLGISGPTPILEKASLKKKKIIIVRKGHSKYRERNAQP